MGKDRERVLGIVPCKSESKRFPGKNFYKFQGMPLYEKAYHILEMTCDKAILAVDNRYNIKPGLITLFRTVNASDTNTSVLDVLKYTYMALTQPYDFIVCLFPSSINYKAQNIVEGIQMIKNNQLQEVRGYNKYTGIENGLLIFRRERLFNPPGISSYLGAVFNGGVEIHYEEELKRYE
jgi:CMP-N-acetylneuraminic acid synthetase